VDEYAYTFDNLANVVEKLIAKLSIERYSMYLMDYGAPVGFRLFVRHPDRVDSLIIQNGNAYDEGLREFWKPLKTYWKTQSQQDGDELRKLLTLEATKWQYTHGVRDTSTISPDNWNVDQRLLDRPGNQEIQLALFYDYGSNPGRYPKWQQTLRKHQPPTLIVWGKNDHIFPADGAHPYKRDLEEVEFHLLDTGHFALEEEGHKIAGLMFDFLNRNVAAK
jgi:pimeloyl-ACP methyl ester carboxylesterase